ncbi:protein 5NUC-like isoform X1 [Orussus abietinus]|uniref:protein 5NUC-like isoform X1 n=1 Tax=Orussus abietinus TaxID=222816 RepID=UPI000625B6E4|nr:protein 5NUC-like isoform X1 [Orussus abietinus]
MKISTAKFEETSRVSTRCSWNDSTTGKCYGGFARIATLIRQARNSTVPSLFLNAGDTYQGTIWYNIHKWKIVTRFLNLLAPDAISLGNHEFDDGVSGLVPFIENASFPILASNLDLKDEPKLQATKLAKSTVLLVNGTKIGVIGYLTPETQFISMTEKVHFLDEVESVSREAKKLKAEGVNILIALGHSGYETDKKIAREVEDIDLVIGGHTNTFLYSGKQPDSEMPEGLYPTEVVQKSGRKVYVVQAYAYTKYLGNFTTTFDSHGEVQSIQGNPVLVDSTVKQAPDILEELEKWRKAIDEVSHQVVGTTRVLLDGDSKTCRRKECNLGNLLTDAFIDYNSRQFAGDEGWTDAAIAVQHSGGIRTSITRHNNDQITTADVLAVLPFSNGLVRVSMTGDNILEMLEWSVRSLQLETTSDLNGAFLQFSGLQVIYDLVKPPNSRVISVRVRCASCLIPTYSDLLRNETYQVLMTDFTQSGGDGYKMLVNLKHTVLGIATNDILVEYLGRRSPVYPSTEWRINYQNTEKKVDETENGSSDGTSYSGSSYVIVLLLAIVSWNV